MRRSEDDLGTPAPQGTDNASVSLTIDGTLLTVAEGTSIM